MKTKKIILLAFLALSASIWASDTNECKKNDIQKIINSNAQHWDYSSLEENYTAALVVFKITKTGEINVENVFAENESFKKLIQTNFLKLNIEVCNFDPNVLYYVKLKYFKL